MERYVLVKVWVQDGRGKPLDRWKGRLKEYMCESERGAARGEVLDLARREVFG